MLDGGLRDVHGVGLPHLEDGDIELRADGLKLLDRGGTIDVAGDEQRALALFAHVAGELGPVRGLARALQTHEHHDARGLRADVQLLVLAAHELAQLLVDDLDDHLGGIERLQHVRAHGALGDGPGKVLDDLIAHVGLEKRHAHLAHGLLHVAGSQPPFAAQPLEGRCQFIG